MARGKQGQAFEGGYGNSNQAWAMRVARALSSMRTASHASRSNSITLTQSRKPSVLPVRHDGWQIPIRAVATVVGLAQLT